MKLSQLLEDVRQINLLTESKGQFNVVLRDLAQLGGEWVLAGGLAVGYHTKPRGTQDVDIFFSDEEALATLKNHLGGSFRQTRPHALEHKATGIEVETLTPEFLKISPQIVAMAIKTAEDRKGVSVVSREGLVALKLQRAENKDKGDIEAIIAAGGSVDLSNYGLTKKQLKLYNELERIVKNRKPLE